MNRTEARARLAHLEGIVHGALARLMGAEAECYFAADRAAGGPGAARTPERAAELRLAALRAMAAVDLADLEASARSVCRQLRDAGWPAGVAIRAAELERWFGLLFDPALRSAAPLERVPAVVQEVATQVKAASVALRDAIDTASPPP